ncbi:TPA: glycosyltransferase [Candidatus Woesearchaeota archaeon]|nr:glycosyltransferase [Candidatus Woesearchaeota archaeon]
MSITLCMIVRDEAEWIGNAISSVKGLARQIEVVDTGSRDGTAELAARLGAEVYSFELNDDTSAARNEGLKRAAGDWILVLDADEAISGSDFGRIRELVKDEKFAGYALVQRNYANDTYREDFVWCLDDDCPESHGFRGTPGRITTLALHWRRSAAWKRRLKLMRRQPAWATSGRMRRSGGRHS